MEYGTFHSKAKTELRDRTSRRPSGETCASTTWYSMDFQLLKGDCVRRLARFAVSAMKCRRSEFIVTVELTMCPRPVRGLSGLRNAAQLGFGLAVKCAIFHA